MVIDHFLKPVYFHIFFSYEMYLLYQNGDPLT